jgi:UDP-N-acetylmuramyl pentapeptide synthase
VKLLAGAKVPLFVQAGEVLISKEKPVGFDYFLINGESVFRVADGVQEKVISYGQKEGKDLFVSDINVGDKETNFKVNYMGDSVPFWLEGKIDNGKLATVLAAISFGVARNINLVDISQALKSKAKL